MVEDKRRRTVGSKDDVQHVGLQGVRSEGAAAGGNAYDLRVFDGRAFLFHHRHVQAGRTHHTRCGFCSSGLAGVVKETVRGEPSVVQSGRDH